MKSKIKNLPDKPGIYFFKDKANQVIYIGKARSLKDRARSYLQSTSDSKVSSILSETTDIDFILTGSEKEAAFLENNYVRQYQPKFNIRLKDDKTFPFLKVTLQERYPGIFLTRRVETDGARYFGPFRLAHQARKTIHLITKYFGIRGCKEDIPGKRKRPCLEYDLKLCSAPCAGIISESEYKESVENALLLLEGKVEKLLKTLKQKMNVAAKHQDYEQAILWRDLIFTLEQIKEKPKLIAVEAKNEDIFGFTREKEYIALYVFIMRKGRVIESDSMFLEEGDETLDKKALSAQLKIFYKSHMDFPDKILLPFIPDRKETLEEDLSLLSGRRIRIFIPVKGKNKRLVELANRNAAILIERKFAESLPLLELKNILNLAITPARIEGFDISNTGGKESVGSLVVFENGHPQKNDYRKYKIKTIDGPNDVASLQEVIRRRYGKALKRKESFPHLILVDGGKGQLNAARDVLKDEGLEDIPVISLAKREETIFSPSHRDGLRLDRTSPALKLIQSIRDEAHRFAISYHRRRREKESFSSLLDGIPGIGPKRKALLLSKYKGIKEIKNAAVEELSKIIGAKASHELKIKLNEK